MTTYFIADTHFGHSNIIGLNNRPFKNVTEMNQQLKENWNKRVHKDDIVYVIGDFWYKGSDNAVTFARGLHGKKHLIIGNHDTKSLNNPQFVAEFESVNLMANIVVDNTWLVLCHYPMAEWDGYYRGSWHIHGHIHNNRKGVFNFLRSEPRALNAGVDITGFGPATFEELKEINRCWKDK